MFNRARMIESRAHMIKYKALMGEYTVRDSELRSHGSFIGL